MSNGATILSTTLPTVLGMGVVSETTKTVFGKGRQGYRPRTSIKMKHGSTVVVGNRVYKLHRGERGGRYYVRKGRKVYV